MNYRKKLQEECDLLGIELTLEEGEGNGYYGYAKGHGNITLLFDGSYHPGDEDWDEEANGDAGDATFFLKTNTKDGGADDEFENWEESWTYEPEGENLQISCWLALEEIKKFTLGWRIDEV